MRDFIPITSYREYELIRDMLGNIAYVGIVLDPVKSGLNPDNLIVILSPGSPELPFEKYLGCFYQNEEGTIKEFFERFKRPQNILLDFLDEF